MFLGFTYLKLGFFAACLLAITGGVTTFIVHERDAGKAAIIAQYQAAAKVESDRQLTSLAETQAATLLLTNQLAETRKARDDLVTENDALSHAFDSAGCLTTDGVRAINRLH
jgi:hypothetical protein